MSDSETVYNLLVGTDMTRGKLDSVSTSASGAAANAGITNGGLWSQDGDGVHITSRSGNHNNGIGLMVAASDLGLSAGETYVFSAQLSELNSSDKAHGLSVWQSESRVWWDGNITHERWYTGAGVYSIPFTYDGSTYIFLHFAVGVGGSATVRRFGVYHAESAAWAPAEGEELAGGGALMSANLLDGVKPEVTQYGSMADGVLTSTASKDAWQDVATWPITADTLTENQTVHIGLSAKWHGTAATTGAAWASVEYADTAGNTNAVNVKIDGITTEWQRLSLSAVVPYGMRIVDFHISADHIDAAFDATSLVLSYGSPVTLASSAHTPYATQDHVAAEYATKAALKVTSDAVTAEVTERGKLAGRVGTLEGTTGTHASRLEQLASSIRSLVKGESTYTDPDGRSATSGIYSLVTQTRDAVTTLFGDYTTTEDLASTAAVQEAKKAGTDAQAAASAAQTTADSASSTAQAAASDAAAAKTDAATAKSDAAGALAETRDLVTLRIESSRGTVFKNSEISTVLTVHCYKRGEEITTRQALRDAMDDQTARIRWWVLREGDADWVSLADSDGMLSNDGFTLTVTPSDVEVKCTFKAEVVTD